MSKNQKNNQEAKAPENEIRQSSENRVTVSFKGKIMAPVDEVFPLLCPKREEEWIEGWVPGTYDLKYSDSGTNEKNCVFQESFTQAFLFGAASPTTWVTTAYDAENHTLEFLLIFGENAVLNRKVACTRTEDSGTSCQWTDTVTFLNGPRDEKTRKEFMEKIMAFSAYLGVMLRHFCEKKQRMPLSAFFEGDGPEELPKDVLANIRRLLSGS